MNGLSLTPDQWIFLFIAYIGIMIALLVFMKARSRGKIKALVLSPSMQYEVKGVPTKGHFLKFNKHWKPEFAPQDIFIEKKPFYAFWRRPSLLIVIAENARKALKWEKEERKKGKKKLIEVLIGKLKHLWTDEEIIQFAEKEAYMAELKIKRITNIEFFVLVMLLISILLMLFLGFNRIGAF